MVEEFGSFFGKHICYFGELQHPKRGRVRQSDKNAIVVAATKVARSEYRTDRK
jgi:hypothetical protein